MNEGTNNSIRSKNGEPTAVLFDVDGTLVDSNYLHVIAWKRALRAADEQVADADIHRGVGMGSDKLLRHLIDPNLSEKRENELSEAHGKEFDKLVEELAVFPSAKDLLKEVHDRKAKVVLATSAKKEDTEKLLKIIDAKDAIDYVVDSGDVDASKPDSDIFDAGLKKAKVSSANAIAVGDTIWDIKAARNAGMDCVCVLTGGNSSADLKEAGAVAIYRDVRELLQKLNESPLARFL